METPDKRHCFGGGNVCYNFFARTRLFGLGWQVSIVLSGVVGSGLYAWVSLRSDD